MVLPCGPMTLGVHTAIFFRKYVLPQGVVDTLWFCMSLRREETPREVSMRAGVMAVPAAHPGCLGTHIGRGHQ